jgi:hypothetical protein
MIVMHGTRRTVVTAAIIGAVALSACGSSSKSSSSSPTTVPAAPSTTTGSSAVCQSFSQFKTALTPLTEASTYTGGKSSIQSALDNVKSNLDNVKTTLQSGDKPKVDALQSSISDFQKALDNMNGISDIPDVTSAGQNVVQSAQAVLDALKAGCPSS